jgi:hypothetical protein
MGGLNGVECADDGAAPGSVRLVSMRVVIVWT